VLLPSFEEIRVFLGASRLGLVRARRGLFGRTLEAVSTPIAGDCADVLAGQLQGKARPVKIYLSNHQVQLLALPWQETLDGDDEWEAYARHAFDTAFGGQHGRRVRIALQGYGQPVIAAAIDEELHAAIQAAIERAGSSLRSVEPWSIAALDHQRRTLGRDCWFFAVEPGMIAGMRIEDGMLASVSMHPIGMDWHGGVAEAIVRELAKHGDDGAAPVFLHSTTPITLDNGILAGVPVKLLAAGRDDSLGMVS
jgi:hypothetical protein